MFEQEPNWEEFNKDTKSSTYGAFNDDGFEEAMGGAKKSAESDAEKKAREEREEKEKAGRENNEKQKLERREQIEKLLEFYKKIIFANHPNEIFGMVDKGATPEKKLKVIKSAFRRIFLEFHEDKYTESKDNISGYNSFPNEIKIIATNVSKLLNAFYAEAMNRAGNVNHSVSESERRNQQARARATIMKDLDLARAAEEAFWNEKSANNGAGEKTEDKSGEKAEEKKTENAEEKTKEDEWEDGADQANHEHDSEDREQAAGEEKTGETGTEKEDRAETETENNKEEKKADPFKEALDMARQEYARTEFRERAALDEVRSFFSRIGGKEDKTETPNIQSARSAYESALRSHMNNQISELENSGLNGDELKMKIKELVTYYNNTAGLDLYNARTEEKIAYKKEKENKSTVQKTWDTVSLKMEQVANWYNKEVPFWVKGGLAVGSFVAGAGVFTSGKRIWGALMMATAGGTQLDALAQFMDKRGDKKASEKAFGEVSKEDGGVDFEKLRGILDGKIDNVESKLQKHVMRSYFNKTVAFSFAAIFGTQAVSGLAHAFGGADVSHVPAGHGFSVKETMQSTNIKTPITDAMNPSKPVPVDYAKWMAEHGQKPPVSAQDVAGKAGVAATENAAGQTEIPKFTMNPGSHQEVMHMPGKDIVKISVPESVGGNAHHDSFAHSLKEYIKDSGKVSPDEVKHVTNVAFVDGVKEYAKTHSMTYDQAINKLSRIHPGTTYEITWDEHGAPKMHINDEDVKFMKAMKHVHRAPSGSGIKIDALQPADGHVASPIDVQDVKEVDAYQPAIEEVQEKLNTTNIAHEAARTRDLSNPGFLHDKTIPNLKPITDLDGPNLEHVAQLEAQADVYKQALKELGAKSANIRDVGGSVISKISGNNHEMWTNMKEASYSTAMKDPESKARMAGIVKTYSKILGKEVFKPKGFGDEPMMKYVGRIVKAISEKGAEIQR